MLDNHIRTLKLPFTFDWKEMIKETSQIPENDWIPHFNTNGYDGQWSSIPLYSVGGNKNDIYASSNDPSIYNETSVLKRCNYLKKVLTTFKIDFLSVRLLRLSSGAKIYPHKDHELGYEDGVFRLHIPIITHSNIEFIVDEHRIVLEQGDCWYINANYTHSVENKSDLNRIHLVMDCVRNDWSDTLFFSLVSKDAMTRQTRKAYDDDTKKRILEELKRMKEPIAEELLKNLERTI